MVFYPYFSANFIDVSVTLEFTVRKRHGAAVESGRWQVPHAHPRLQVYPDGRVR